MEHNAVDDVWRTIRIQTKPVNPVVRLLLPAEVFEQHLMAIRNFVLSIIFQYIDEREVWFYNTGTRTVEFILAISISLLSTLPVQFSCPLLCQEKKKTPLRFFYFLFISFTKLSLLKLTKLYVTIRTCSLMLRWSTRQL